MIDAAIEALRRHGVAGTSFTEILETSGAARGAIYHHFPGGKAELVAEAARVNAEAVRAGLAELSAENPVRLIRAFLEAVRPVVDASAHGSGCAVAAVAVGADVIDADVRAVAQAGFDSWTDALAGRLTAAGLARAEATELATTLLMLLEGAQVLCRAAGTLEPFDHATHTIFELVESRHGTPTRTRPRRGV